jgi:quinol monooxygenase YgiN
MVTMFVKHQVGDYNNWKRVYDEIAPFRKESGVTTASVHRALNDHNSIIITHQFRDMNAAKKFADSEDLKSAMKKAGVNSQPEFWFAEDLEKTPY